MAAPDYTTEIAALEAALASGELTVEQDGERVTYRAVSDLVKALSHFQSKAATAAAGAASSSQFGFSAPAYSRD